MYGDVVEEIDASAGRILDAIDYRSELTTDELRRLAGEQVEQLDRSRQHVRERIVDADVGIAQAEDVRPGRGRRRGCRPGDVRPAGELAGRVAGGQDCRIGRDIIVPRAIVERDAGIAVEGDRVCRKRRRRD